jgi:hypothetical protein
MFVLLEPDEVELVHKRPVQALEIEPKVLQARTKLRVNPQAQTRVTRKVEPVVMDMSNRTRPRSLTL